MSVLEKLPRLVLSGLLLVSCGAPVHISTYKPKHREYDLPVTPDANAKPPTPGSLWHDGDEAALLFSDARALRVNDLVVVKIEEVADAQRSSNTDLTHNSTTGMTLIAAMNKSPVNPTAQLSSVTQNSFQGDGSTARTERVTATVPAIVKKVLPNGNLFIEGHREVLVNSEEHHYYISGVVRPIDIDGENSVKSSMVADAEVEFTGSGQLTDNNHQGFLSRFWNFIWPF